jgi:hypothetical protein
MPRMATITTLRLIACAARSAAAKVPTVNASRMDCLPVSGPPTDGGSGDPSRAESPEVTPAPETDC